MKINSRILRGVLCFIVMVLALPLQAQNVIITGQVNDSKGEPMIGAVIMVKDNDMIATTSNIDGEFSISVPATTKALIINSIGYIDAEVPCEGKSHLSIVLEDESYNIDDVVVVGYGTVRKADMTGSVASIKGENMSADGATNVAQMMKGQLAGVSFGQWSSQPGAKVTMTIRGDATGAEPLVIVDGFQMTTFSMPDSGTSFTTGSTENIFDSINPEDIADIQVLKDASATSIYGSRAAGGVILITTKKGTEDKLDITFNASYGIQKIVAMADVLSASEYMETMNKAQLERYVYEQGYYPWGDAELPSYNALVAEYMTAHAGEENGGFMFDPNSIDSFDGGTDWLDLITRDGAIQRYDISLRGGSKDTKYYVSASYLNNVGVMENNEYRRINGLMNIDQKINRWLDASFKMSYSQSKTSAVPLGADDDTYDLYRSARTFDPTLSIYDENGDYTSMDATSLSRNPASLLDIDLESSKETFVASTILDAKITKNLNVRATAGYNRNIGLANSYIPSTTYAGSADQGSATKSMTEAHNYLTNTVATYNNTFAGKHNLTAMVGWEYQKTTQSGFSATNKTFPNDDIKWNNLQQGTYLTPEVSSSYTSEESASAFSRLNYSYDDRYLLTINYRLDGSSNFAANKQWGSFGGVALAWRITEEEFLKNKVDWLNSLKLRLSAGTTGNAGSLTNTTTYYQTGYAYNYNFDNSPTIGIGLAALGNPDLSWETQRDVNLGLDFSLFNGRLSGEADIYERTIFNRIGWMSLASYQTVTTIAYNTERIDKTRGVDLALRGTIIDNKDWSWNTSLTYTYSYDFTTKRDPSEILDIYESDSYRWDEIWSYVSSGLVQPGESPTAQSGALAGSVRLMDINGYLRDDDGNIVYDSSGKPQYLGQADGIIDNADLVLIAYSNPIPIGFSNTIRYKDFELYIYAYAKLNVWKNNTYATSTDYSSVLNGTGTNTSTYILDRYSFDNLDSTVPSIYRSTGTYGVGDYNYQKAWFIRLDDIKLSYNIPKRFLNGVAQSVKVYASVDNIAVITPFEGGDPEYDVYSTYPSTRTYTFGANIKF